MGWGPVGMVSGLVSELESSWYGSNAGILVSTCIAILYSPWPDTWFISMPKPAKGSRIVHEGEPGLVLPKKQLLRSWTKPHPQL